MTAVNLLGDLALQETQEQLRDLLADIAARAATAAAQQATLDLLEEVRTPSGAFAVGNARSKFRDGFASTEVGQPDPAVWTLLNDHPDTGVGPGGGAGHIVDQGGDSNGASYLRISMSPFVDNSSVWLVSKDTFTMPTRVGWGISASQRIVGQELLFGLAEAAPAGSSDPTTIRRNPPQTPADVPITATSASLASNTLTVPVPVGHPFRAGDRVILLGCADTRMNVGPVVIGSSDATNITVPIGLTNGAYNTTGGAVRSADPLARANNGFGLLLENTNVGNASLVGRRNGAKARIRNQGIASTSAVASPNWSDAFLTPSVHELTLSMDECAYRSWPSDSPSGPSGMDKFTQSIPDEELDYRLVVRARNLDDLSKPVARIVNAVKTGTTTATVTTDRPHGLTTNSRIGLNGARDQSLFVNTPDVAVASVIDATTFTVNWGPAGTGSITSGGVVYINHGQVSVPGASGFAIQTIARSNGVLVVTVNTTVSGFSPGEYVHLWGMNGPGAAALEGAYKIMRIVGSTLEVAAPGTDLAAVTTGGALIKRTDYRLHFVRVLDHTRHFVEVLGGRGNTSDGNNAIPVSTVGTQIVSSPGIVVEQVETNTALGVNGTYAGGARDLGGDFGRQSTRIRAAIRHLAGNVHGHLALEQSSDNFASGASTFETWRVPIPSDGAVHTFEVPLLYRYYRWRFYNAGVAQTGFHFQTRRTLAEGTVASEIARSLLFNLTPGAGQAAAAGATTTFPVLDLGANHSWDRIRLLAMSDQASAASGLFVQQAQEGSNWLSVRPFATLGVNDPQAVEVPIIGRFLRVVHTNGTTAATALRVMATLLTL